MPRTPVITTSQQTVIQSGQTGYSQYILTCPNETVFACQVNQNLTGVFNIAQFTYDTVTVGAYTDALEGFTVFISRTNDIKAAYFVGRVRKALTTDTFYINQTSVAIQDNDYVFVVKDIRAVTKLGRAVPSGTSTITYFKDYDIAFRLLIPTVYNLQTVYVGVLNREGYVDIEFPAIGRANENGASIASYAWTTDGAAFQVGDSTTQQPTLRFTESGHYMPRVTVTDDGSLTGWFSPHVFIVPYDYNGTVNTGFTSASITASTSIGWTASVTANATTGNPLSYIDDLLDENFVAIWTPSTREEITSDIVMCGRFRQETVNHDITPNTGVRLSTSFEIEGIGGQLQRIVAQRVPMVQSSSPTEFGYIDTLTPYRAVMYYLTEYTTLTSCHSIEFDAYDNTYIVERAATNDGNVLSAIEDLLFMINGGVEHYGTGELYMARKAWYQNDTDRDALSTVIGLSMSDIQVPAGGGQAWSVVNDYAVKVAKEVSGGAWYDTTTENTSLPVKIITPAVAPARGSNYLTLNRQVLTANSSLPDAVEELGQRTANDTAANQPQTIFVSPLLDGFSFFQPSVSQWYTWVIAGTDNNRGISYNTTDRWTLFNVSINYLPTGRRTITGSWLLESQNSDYSQTFSLPPTGEPHYWPPGTIVPEYPNFPEADSLGNADAGNPNNDDEQPFDEDDGDTTDGDLPGDTETPPNAGVFMVVWNADNIWKLSGVHTLEPPTAQDMTPSVASDYSTIADVKFNRQSPSWGLLCFKNDGTDSALVSDFYLNGAWTSLKEYQGVWSKLRSRGSLSVGYTEDQGAIDGDLFITFEDGGDEGYVFEEHTTDVGANSDYTVEASYIRPDSIDGGNCAGRSATESSQTIDGIGINDEMIGSWVKVEFEAAITVTDVTFEHLIFRTGSVGSQTRTVAVEYYDDSDNLLSTQTDSNPFSQNIWINRSLSTPVEGVSYVWIGVYFVRFAPFTGRAWIKDIDITGEASGVAIANIRPRNFNGRPKAGPSVMIQPTALASSKGALGLGLDSALTYAAVDEKIVDNSADETFGTDTPGGNITTPEEALAIRFYGLSAPKYLIAPAISVSSDTLWKVEGGTATAISPNDGVADGIIINDLGGLFTFDATESIFCVLANFAGTVKFAYSTDGGSNWTFNEQISGAASYITGVKRGAFYYIYIADGTTLWWVEWDGLSTITLIARTMPAAITGVEHP